eukprot:2781736-Karenia_brevis.AAC.1
MAIVISCLHLLKRLAFASAPKRRLACSAAKLSVRITAGCGAPSLVQTIGRKAMPAWCNSLRMRAYFRSFPLKAAAAASPPAPPFSGLVTVTSRAADRPGRAAVVRMSA